MVSDDRSKDAAEVWQQTERWLAGEGREAVADVTPVLAVLRDRLGELQQIPAVRDDEACRLLIETMAVAPDEIVFHRLVQELEIRVKALSSGLGAEERNQSSVPATPRRPAAPTRRLLKL